MEFKDHDDFSLNDEEIEECPELDEEAGLEAEDEIEVDVEETTILTPEPIPAGLPPAESKPRPAAPAKKPAKKAKAAAPAKKKAAKKAAPKKAARKAAPRRAKKKAAPRKKAAKKAGRKKAAKRSAARKSKKKKGRK